MGKLIIWLAAAIIAAGGVTVAPAVAQSAPGHLSNAH
jgi:hypothetical protein